MRYDTYVGFWLKKLGEWLVPFTKVKIREGACVGMDRGGKIMR